MSNQIPRRCRLDLNTSAEHIIYDAIVEVEKLAADVRLTDAVILLGEARDAVADFVDDAERTKRRFIRYEGDTPTKASGTAHAEPLTVKFTHNDEVVLGSICVMFERDDPRGLNWPGVARLIRRLLVQHATQQAELESRRRDFTNMKWAIDAADAKAEHLESRFAAQQAALQELRERAIKAGWAHSPGSLDVVYVNDVVDWLDELALLGELGEK